MLNINELISQKPDPQKLMCRIRLCRPKQEVYYGYAIYEDEQKKNHPPAKVEGLYQILQCPDCKRVVVHCIAWKLLNEQKAREQ